MAANDGGDVVPEMMIVRIELASFTCFSDRRKQWTGDKTLRVGKIDRRKASGGKDTGEEKEKMVGSRSDL